MDHGSLNTSLKSRGDIDAQLDRYKAQQAAEARVTAKQKAEQTRIDRAAAHKLLDDISEAELRIFATRFNKSMHATCKQLRRECHWQPQLIIKLLTS